jgi:hypothetical protein
MPTFTIVEVWGTLFAVTAIAGLTCAGLVFLLAGLQKMQHWRLLAGVIANYRLLPGWAVGPAAALLPPLELLLAVLLLSAQLQPWPVIAAIALLLLFAAAMAINVTRGRTHIDCGCGQEFLAQHLSWTLVARNLVLGALLIASLGTAIPVPLSEAVTGATAGLGFFLLYLLFNVFSALPQSGLRRFA